MRPGSFETCLGGIEHSLAPVLHTPYRVWMVGAVGARLVKAACPYQPLGTALARMMTLVLGTMGRKSDV